MFLNTMLWTLRMEGYCSNSNHGLIIDLTSEKEDGPASSRARDFAIHFSGELRQKLQCTPPSPSRSSQLIILLGASTGGELETVPVSAPFGGADPQTGN